jgi:glycosyltransferase involved in cell wall biosynthesis
MKILVVTQAVDIHNTTLGFFHRWIIELSTRFDLVEVVCLYEGEYDLPPHVHVHSLGKEKGNTRIQYIKNFFCYIWKLRKQYDVVFVHMNQEYIVLGGVFWKLFGKKVFFWRNHPYGNIWTRIAVLFSNQVFCTADQSFTARYSKTHVMPAGIDTSVFSIDTAHERPKYSLLSFGRIAPVKHIEKSIDATASLLARGVPVELSIVGDWLSRDEQYVENLKKRIAQAHIESSVHFIKGVDFIHAPHTYQSHEIFLNFTDSGSFDKTVVEALACGTKVLVSNDSMKDLLPYGSYTTGEQDDIVEKIIALQSFNLAQEEEYRIQAEKIVQQHSLSRLMDLLYTYIHGNK